MFETSQPNRPNILLILTDQLRLDILSSYGGDICQTPNLDRLAARSVIFDKAYTPLAVCSPARGSVMTGLYPHNHGVCSNHTTLANGTLRDSPMLLSRRLEQLGYDRFYLGKWHLGGEGALPRHFGFPGLQFPGHGGGGYHFPEFQEYLQRNNLQFEFADGPHKLGWHRYGTLKDPAEAEPSAFLTDAAIEYLDARDRQSSSPFFLWINYWGPHEPYFAPQKFVDLYKDVTIPPWPNYPDDNPNKPRMHQYKIPPESRDEGWTFWEPAVRHYFAFMSFIDQQIGRLLNKLEQSGLDENTIIMFSADHGESIGAHGCQDKGHFMYEEIYRIPLYMSGPGLLPRRERELVSLLDFCPTILDYAGEANPDENRDGRSLKPLLEQRQTNWRSTLVSEFHGLETPITQRMIVDERYKYVWNMGDLDECYDLQEDPYERNNLIGNADARLLSRFTDRFAGMDGTNGRPGQKLFQKIPPSTERRCLIPLLYFSKRNRPTRAIGSACFCDWLVRTSHRSRKTNHKQSVCTGFHYPLIRTMAADAGCTVTTTFPLS